MEYERECAQTWSLEATHWQINRPDSNLTSTKIREDGVPAFYLPLDDPVYHTSCSGTAASHPTEDRLLPGVLTTQSATMPAETMHLRRQPSPGGPWVLLRPAEPRLQGDGAAGHGGRLQGVPAGQRAGPLPQDHQSGRDGRAHVV